MTKSKKRGHLKLIGNVPPGHPIYRSGHIMLRPVHGRTPTFSSKDSAKTTPPEKPRKGAKKSIYDDPFVLRSIEEGFEAQWAQMEESALPASAVPPSPAQTPPLPGQDTRRARTRAQSSLRRRSMKAKQSGHERLRKAIENGWRLDLNNLPIDPIVENERLAKVALLKRQQEKKSEKPKS